MRLLLIGILFILLSGCSFGGFKPAPTHDHWRLHNSKVLFPNSDPERTYKYLDRREKDMKGCGMDFVIGESDDPDVNLCMESKGWYLKGGPICEEKTMWNRPSCIRWRKKHSKSNIQPWGCKNSTYPTCLETGSQRE